MIDKLTGLLVQKEFEERLTVEVQRALRYRRPLTVMLMEVDFDHFEPTRGMRHNLGYTIFKQFGPLLLRQLRKVDMGGRIGGETFAALLPETGLSGAFIAGDRIRKNVETHEFLGEDMTTRLQLALNVGMATFPDHGISGEELMATAHKALLMVRRDGGNQCVVYPESLYDATQVFATMAPPYHGGGVGPVETSASDDGQKPVGAAGQDSEAPE